MVPARRPKLLSSTRVAVAKAATSRSSRHTRTTVQSHHTLCKQLQSAINRGDDESAENIKAQINDNGGIKAYQAASLLGQSASRGGDSSRVLMQWLKEHHDDLVASESRDSRPAKLRLLEIGALQIDNACARSRLFDVERIDLRSQHELIRQQDFMDMPLPKSNNDRFDIVSLSLVLNYVPDPVGRGEMLKRISAFLRPRHSSQSQFSRILPALFLVLPAPCVLNSRYLDNARLEEMMGCLGYSLTFTKTSAKLVYYYWTWNVQDADRSSSSSFKKKEIQPGGTRNNFTIVMT